jgi:transaldolase
MHSKLDQLRAMTVVVGDTGDIEAVRRLKPKDCTTNPSLILKAVNTPAGNDIVAEAVRLAAAAGGGIEARTVAACDRIAVAFGSELAGIVHGRVSTEVDADLSFDSAGSIAKAQANYHRL